MNDLIDGCRHQKLALQFQQLLVGDAVAMREIGDRSARQLVLQKGVNVDTAGIVDAAFHVAHANNLAAHIGKQPHRPGSYLPKSLDHYARAGGRNPDVVCSLPQYVDRTPAGGGVAAYGASQFNRLSGDDAGRVAVYLAVSIHHPRHRLRISAQVRRWNVPVDP